MSVHIYDPKSPCGPSTVTFDWTVNISTSITEGFTPYRKTTVVTCSNTVSKTLNRADFPHADLTLPDDTFCCFRVFPHRIFTKLLPDPDTGKKMGRTNGGIPQFAINDARGWEDAGFLWFVVTLSRVQDHPVMVDFATSNLSAVDGTDYTGLTGTLTFAPGEFQKTVTIALIADEDAIPPVTPRDGTKEFEVTLSNPVGGAVSPLYYYGTGTILDNETAYGYPTNHLETQAIEQAIETPYLRNVYLFIATDVSLLGSVDAFWFHHSGLTFVASVETDWQIHTHISYENGDPDEDYDTPFGTVFAGMAAAASPPQLQWSAFMGSIGLFATDLIDYLVDSLTKVGGGDIGGTKTYSQPRPDDAPGYVVDAWTKDYTLEVTVS